MGACGTRFFVLPGNCERLRTICHVHFCTQRVRRIKSIMRCYLGVASLLVVLTTSLPTKAQTIAGYRLQCQTVYRQEEVTAYRLESFIEMSERQVTTYRPVWETEVRERRYTVARPVAETNMREERSVVLKPVCETQYRDASYNRVRYVTETGTREERVCVMRQVWEESTREERCVIQRPVTTTVMQNRVCTTYDPVTTTQTQMVDQGQYVDQVSLVAGRERNQLRWMNQTNYVDPVTGQMNFQRAGFYWVPSQGPTRQVVNRVWVANPVAVQTPVTNYVARQVTEQVPVQVTQMQQEVQVRQVPVRVCRMEQVEEVRQVPFTTCRPIVERVEQQIPVQVMRYERQEIVRQVPVVTYKMQYEERVEQQQVQVCRMVAETSTVQEPHTVCRRVPVTYTRLIPTTVVHRIPIDCCGNPIAISTTAASAATTSLSPMTDPAEEEENEPASDSVLRQSPDANDGADENQAEGEHEHEEGTLSASFHEFDSGLEEVVRYHGGALTSSCIQIVRELIRESKVVCELCESNPLQSVGGDPDSSTVQLTPEQVLEEIRQIIRKFDSLSEPVTELQYTEVGWITAVRSNYLAEGAGDNERFVITGKLHQLRRHILEAQNLAQAASEQ